MKIQDSRNTQGIKITGTSFFPKKKRLRQCITHTQGIKITGTSFFSKKKRLRQCITHTQGIKIPGTSLFPKKKVPAAVHHTHTCILYTTDDADEPPCVELGGHRILKKKKNQTVHN